MILIPDGRWSYARQPKPQQDTLSIFVRRTRGHILISASILRPGAFPSAERERSRPLAYLTERG